MSTPSDSGESSKPKNQPSRPVCLLTPEQLKRKRVQDRESQRQTRERTKQTIAQLQKRVEELTRELHATKLQNASLEPKNQLYPPGTIRMTADPMPMPSEPVMDIIMREKVLPPRQFGPMRQQFTEGFFLDSPISTDSPAGVGILDQSLLAQFPYENFQQHPLTVQVWQAMPVHLPPTCRLDKILIDLVESMKAYDPIGSTTYEFSSPKFPSVAALLNPQNHSTTYPLTTAIVSNVIYVLTVADLPEQIAIMYVMCCICRWQITGSKEDYDAMPDWLRPGAAQIVTAHPAWVDTFPWPKARDRLCRDLQYHDRYEEFKSVCNESISINWPYEPEDTLITLSNSEYVVNPVFITHIRNNANWTLGPNFLQAFPDFEHDVTIGRPRNSGR